MRLCGISRRFHLLSPCTRQVTHALLTRPPLSFNPKISTSFDLHVLGTPPAFILSQDQTLVFDLWPRSTLLANLFRFYLSLGFVLFLKFFLWNFQGWNILFVYQGACFRSVVSDANFYILSHLNLFVNNFFKVFSKSFFCVKNGERGI